jgi:hypothetical protein
MPAPDEVYRGVTRLFGAAIVIVTLANGGGPLSTGVLLGILFMALGGGRYYLATRGRAER